MKVSRAFLEAFNRVHAAFQTAPAEIEEAKAVVRANLVAAEDAYYGTAALLAAGWDPMKEQASAFLERTGFTVPKRWLIEPRPDIAWPSLSLAA